MILRLTFILALGLTGAWAQEHGAANPAAEHASQGPKEISIFWKWANFALLAGGLYYLISKNAPAYFASRNEEIRKGLQEGAELQREANLRTTAMEARLQNLQSEIVEMKTKAKADIGAEAQRIQAETAAAIEKLQIHSESEIASAAKYERAQLKMYAADLALRLAEDKLRNRMSPEVDAGLMQGFLKGLN